MALTLTVSAAGPAAAPQLPEVTPVGESSAFVVAVSNLQLPPKPTPEFHVPPKWTYCKCVEYAKQLTGHTGRSYGAAKYIKPNLDHPEIGAWALMNEGPGHAVVIVEIASTSFKTSEANYFECQKSSRWISFDDPLIRGYFQP